MSAIEWRTIPGHEHYEVSSDGRVRSLPRMVGTRYGTKGRLYRGGIQAPNRDRNGYARAFIDGKSMKVHRLVLLAFVGPPSDPSLFGCHNDGDPTNNHVENLRWDTPKANIQDSLKHGTNFLSNKTECIYGHHFTPENTYIQPSNGSRSCRICRRALAKAYKRRQPRVRGSKSTAAIGVRP